MSKMGAAEKLLNDPLLNEILDGLERDAFELCVNAKPSDDEQRRTTTQEIRAIRSLRGKLKLLSKSKTKPTGRGSVV